VHIEPILSRWSWCLVKKSFIISNTSLAFDVVFSAWQNKKLQFPCSSH